MMRSRSAASSLREAEKHLARISPWLRWGPEDEVLDPQLGGLADDGRLLADAEVGGAAVVVLHAIPRTGGLDRVEHGLEAPHGDHVVQDVDQPLLAVAFQLGLEVGFVSIDGHLGGLDGALGTHVRRIDDQ